VHGKKQTYKKDFMAKKQTYKKDFMAKKTNISKKISVPHKIVNSK
jgi:hypothetical protein